MMSSHFIYYLRHPFNEYHEQVLQLYTTLAQTVQSLNDKLILMPSNLVNENKFRYGRVDSDKYLDRLNRDAKIDLGKFTKYFKNIECYLMPEPAEPMRTGMLDNSLTHYTVDEVGQRYLKYIHDFRWQTMATANGLKTSATGRPMRGLDFHQALRPLFELITSNRLEKLPNQMDMLSADHYRRLADNLVQQYLDESVVFDVYNQLDDTQIQDNHQRLVSKLLTKFTETDNPYEHWSHKSTVINSTDNPDDANDDHRQQLVTKLSHQFTVIYKNGQLFRQSFEGYRTGMRWLILQLFDNLNNDIPLLDHQLRDVSDLVIKNLTKTYNDMTYKMDQNLDFADKLVARMNDYFRANDQIVTELIARVNEYKTELKASIDQKSLLAGLAGRYNQWLDSHREVFPEIYSRFGDKILSTIERFGNEVVDNRAINYSEAFIDITKHVFSSESGLGWWSDTLIDGTLVVGEIGAFVVLGPVAAVKGLAGHVVYDVVRYMWKPDSPDTGAN
ncbi:uncharacterized protein LOC128965054 [Oppia nitens]|uniref:uncharacterized protein LOC128965054 n=1 Tax=Oppia nitens TaxID=1686743 RepID=UPI0023D99031|nr:uncharacterized protein LOC128965054 [Oppia nitens]